MCASVTFLLDELGEVELAREREQTRFPKWATACLLRSLGLPTLDCCLLLPESNAQSQAEAAERFACRHQTDRLLVRSDGGSEVRSYYRGGNTFGLSAAIRVCQELTLGGRAAILAQPTSRFSNRLAVNFAAERDGRFLVEMLGPGYDVSDLNRGGVLPQVIIRVGGVVWDRYEPLQLSDLHVERLLSEQHELARRTRRLEVLGSEVLPALGETAPGGGAAEAEAWLRHRGFLHLWTPWEPPISLAYLRARYDDMFIIGAWMFRHRGCDVVGCSASDLGDGRFVYWDVVDASTKFGRSSR